MLPRFAFTNYDGKRPPRVPRGKRVYAIGDVHGQFGMLRKLIDAIAADSATREPADIHVVFLGDVIDRGPDSRRVLEALARLSGRRVVLLLGNHEGALIDAYAGDRDAIDFWLRFGGKATLKAFGVRANRLCDDPERMAEVIRDAIPERLIRWLRGRPASLRIGDYFFAHAGIRPGVALNRQLRHDLLWGAGEFLGSLRPHGAMIVHGHHIVDDVEFRSNRICIDTGAYRQGRLSALCLEGSRRWTIQVSHPTRLAIALDDAAPIVAVPPAIRVTQDHEGPGVGEATF